MSSMGRRSLITSKSKDRLELHLFMMIARYNKYDLNEILKHEQFKDQFFEREWQIRKQKKVLKNLSPILIAHIWKQKEQRNLDELNRLVVLLATILHHRSKNQSTLKVA